ncbi:dephospho-CoA kinase [Cyanobacterium stanieri LEGE 03274]|uniref:Dephospho-CoA kinase n=1 Tax=Cyanobacterium stanieri LEGE 03274 TaxID=1828756 RepID=A0ABR9V2X9_9CHRO|nr:dephospho-CoA kinase [Cyanobacterium stanieri]MBE9222251.1 dephospho-CoA kinase [Cyanobacterium stanieri LEGE 03274]
MIIGLTGGIATGKSTVSDYLQNKYQIPIVDADVLAREAVKVYSPIYKRIVKRYGAQILLADVSINRGKLGEIIFNDESEKLWLEAQIHPYVRQEIEREVRECEAPIMVLSIPLLFEAKMTDLVDQIWVVYADFETQVTRLQRRNGLSKESAIARITSQMPLREKLKRADIIIDNSGDIKDLYQIIDQQILTRT